MTGRALWPSPDGCQCCCSACSTGAPPIPWYSWQEALFFSGFVILLPLFLFVENKTEDPIIPLNLFRIRMISSSFAIQFVRGGVLLGLTAFVIPFIIGSISAGQLLARWRSSTVSQGQPTLSP